MKSITKGGLLALVALLVAVLLVVGCAPKEPVTPPAEEKVVKVGFQGALSGPAALCGLGGAAGTQDWLRYDRSGGSG